MEAWAYEYDLHKRIWITLYLSPPLTHCSLLFSLCIWHMDQAMFSSVCWVSGPVVPSVRVLRLSVVFAREMQKCEREMQQCSSCFIPRSLALLIERFSELLLHVVFLSSWPSCEGCSLARSLTHSRQAEDSCALNDWGSMIFVSVIRLEAQLRSAKQHLKSDSCQPDLLQQKCASVTSNTPK